jgi:hypothetical protein
MQKKSMNMKQSIIKGIAKSFAKLLMYNSRLGQNTRPRIYEIDQTKQTPAKFSNAANAARRTKSRNNNNDIKG